MHEIVILSAARTPIGAFQGGLASLSAPALGGRALAASIERSGLGPDDIDQVNMGCVLTAGLGQAPARQAAIAAGCPVSTGALTLNKVCGSGMQAVMLAANDLRCGDFAVVAAGGMESMSRVPYLSLGARNGLRLGNSVLVDGLVHDGLWDVYNDYHMGNCAELCARERGFSREQQDAFAISSYERARAAIEEGRFESEVAPVEVENRAGTSKLERDEDPFRVDLGRAGTLRPAFQKDGTVTAANASNLSDGAAALVLTNARLAEKRGLEPMARVLAQATFAQQPEWFTTAPVEAIRGAIKRAGLEIDDIDLFEINEAFAVVALACMRELGLDHDRVNVHGGAVALGHPIGASGARILVTLLHAMQQRRARRGCAAICIGGGEATAMVVEAL